MKVATWNVNSLKVRLPHLIDWLAAEQPDAVCLQETKTGDAGFPFAQIAVAGYHAIHNGQKTYNGVAILSRGEPDEIVRDLPGFADEQKRLIAATVAGVRLICAYMPNGQAVGSDKFAYKLQWFEALARWLGEEMRRHPELALLGDFNVAPEDRDVHDPVAWQGQVLCSEPERAAFRRLLALGLVDAFRLFDQPERSFTWWDYRMMAFRRNHGLRIDHILVSSPLAARCRACRIDTAPRKLERPSDHAPVIAEFA
ncbi:MAG: exodeoxyribonuclease III [Rhodocyclaceae bacterium]